MTEKTLVAFKSDPENVPLWDALARDLEKERQDGIESGDPRFEAERFAIERGMKLGTKYNRSRTLDLLARHGALLKRLSLSSGIPVYKWSIFFAAMDVWDEDISAEVDGNPSTDADLTLWEFAGVAEATCNRMKEDISAERLSLEAKRLWDRRPAKLREIMAALVADL